MVQETSCNKDWVRLAGFQARQQLTGMYMAQTDIISCNYNYTSSNKTNRYVNNVDISKQVSK